MKSKMNRVEVVFIGITIFVLAGIAIFYFYRKSRLKKEGVYVLGKLINVKELENGYTLYITYRVGDQEYKYSYKTLPRPHEEDSMFFVLASKSKPRICKLLIDTKVPKCFYDRKFLDSVWNQIPYCSTKSSAP
jgi:hypothetical protein